MTTAIEIINWTSYIMAWIGYLTPLAAAAVGIIDICLKYRNLVIEWREGTRPNRVAQKQLSLPGRTPVVTGEKDCLLGSTAALTHIVDQAESRSTSEVHEIAKSVLVKRGHEPSWALYIESGDEYVMGLTWHEILQRLDLGFPRQLWFSVNQELAGKGILVMSNKTVAHAVTFAHGLVSDPSRPSGAPTWETLDTVEKRFEMTARSVYIFEECADGSVGFVPYGVHTCTYQAVA